MAVSMFMIVAFLFVLNDGILLVTEGYVVEFNDTITCLENGAQFTLPKICPLESNNDPFLCTINWKQRPCKCDHDCSKYNECCIDKEEAYYQNGTYVHASLYPDFSDGELPDKMAWEYDFLPYMSCVEVFNIRADITAFQMISRCPSDIPLESPVRISCEDSQLSDRFFTTPVTVRSIGHFRNIYCALCHKMSYGDIEPWYANWECSIILPGQVSSADDEGEEVPIEELMGIDACFAIYKPPDGIPLNITPRPCYNIDVTTCSSNFTSNPNEQMACPSYLAPVSHDGVVYQNIPCAYCNGLDACRNYLDYCKGYKFNPQVSSPQGLATFFLFSPEELSMLAMTCAPNEAFDPVTRTCKVVYCWPGFAYNSTTELCEVIPTDEVARACFVVSTVFGGLELLNTSSVGMSELSSYLVDILVLLPIEGLSILDVGEVGTLSTLSCNSYEDVRIADRDECGLGNQGLECRICYDFFVNFTTLLMAETESIIGANSSWQFPSCFSSASLGNVSVSEVVFEAAAGWNCSTVSPQVSQIANDEGFHPFVMNVSRRNGTFVLEQYYAETTCSSNGTLSCFNGRSFEANVFDLVTADTGEVTLKLIDEDVVIQAGDFIVMPDGSARYCVQNRSEIGSDLPEGLNIVSFVGTSLSMVSLLIVIVTYATFPRLRNVAGMSVLSLSVSLFAVFLLMCLSELTSEENVFCRTVAAVIHFFWLTVFFWMNALAIDLSRTFGIRAKTRVGTTSSTHFIWYSLYAWGVPALIVGAFLALDLCECTDFNVGYGSYGICWLSRGNASIYGFGVPLAVLLLLNAILFTDTIVGIRLAKKAAERALKERSAIEKAKEELSLYIKLSSIMGFSWALGYVCDYANVPELWFVFTAVNSLQGLFLLLVFGFNRRNTALWRKKLGLTGKETPSTSNAQTKSSSISATAN